jgi:hypothetical protein
MKTGETLTDMLKEYLGAKSVTIYDDGRIYFLIYPGERFAPMSNKCKVDFVAWLAKRESENRRKPNP